MSSEGAGSQVRSQKNKHMSAMCTSGERGEFKLKILKSQKCMYISYPTTLGNAPGYSTTNLHMSKIEIIIALSPKVC